MKRIVSVLLLAAIIMSLAACSCTNYTTPFERSYSTASEIKLVKDESYYDDFEIDEKRNVVNFICSLTFENTSDKEVRFYLVGDFKDSFESRLVTARFLRGLNYEDKNERLTLKGKEKKTFTFIFKGDHGKRNQKPNRSLPEIMIYKLS